MPGGLRVRCEHEAGASTEHEAGWLVNATGPDADITRTGDPLLRDLFGRGLARPDPLRLGLDATPGGAVLDAAGRPSGTLFTLGPPLRGLWYETTAIPEIRTQAAALALRLTAATRCPPARAPPPDVRLRPAVCPPRAAGRGRRQARRPAHYEWVTFCPVRCGCARRGGRFTARVPSTR